MSNTSTWTWKDGKPPGPQTARAGETWILHLPLVGTGPAPMIDWMDVPPGLSVTPIPGDELSFSVQIAADLSGIQTLSYRRVGEPRADQLMLKVLPARSAQPNSAPTTSADASSHSTSTSAPQAAAPSSPSKAQPGLSIVGQRIAPPQGQPANIPTPQDVRVRSQPSAPPTPKPTETGDGQSSVPPAAPAPSSPSASGPRSTTGLDPNREYEIQVYRHGTLISQLNRPLLLHKSLLVGKFSASKAVFPDIDLRHQFIDQQSESLCSRQQARIYWSHDQIQLLNIGKSPITLPDGRPLATDQAYPWMPGEEVILPGGLSLRLAVLGY